MKKRILAGLLTAIMAFSMLPISAMAAEEPLVMPTRNELEELFDNDITVQCYFEEGVESNEVSRSYPFLWGAAPEYGEIENGRVTASFDINIYVQAYSSFFEDQTSWGHFAHVKLDPDSNKMTFDLVWNEETGSWEFADGVEPVIQVKHVQPDFGTARDTIGQSIKVVCEGGESQTFELLVDSSVYWQKDRPRRTTYQGEEAVSMTVELNKEAYVQAFSESYGPHTMAEGQDKTYELTMYYINDGSDEWVLAEGTKIDPIQVVPAAPEAPAGTALDELLGPVTLSCANGHEAQSYNVSEVSGGYTVGEIVKKEANTWTCELTVPAAPFVEQYSEWNGNEHILSEGQKQEKTVTLTYTPSTGWKAEKADLSFQVVCPHPKVDAIQVRMSPDVQKLYNSLGGWFNARWTHVDNTKSIKGYYEMGENQWNDNTYCVTAAEVTGVTIGDRYTKYWFPMGQNNGDYARLKVSYEYMYSPADVFHIFGKQFTMILECDTVKK